MRKALLPLAITLCSATGPAGAQAPEGGGLLDSLRAAGEQISKGVQTGVRANLSGENIVVGTVEISSPIVGILTCFKDVPGGLISPRPIANPSQGRGAPVLIVTRSGVLATGECAKLASQGLLVPAAGASTPASGQPAGRQTIGEIQKSSADRFAEIQKQADRDAEAARAQADAASRAEAAERGKAR